MTEAWIFYLSNLMVYTFDIPRLDYWIYQIKNLKYQRYNTYWFKKIQGLENLDLWQKVRFVRLKICQVIKSNWLCFIVLWNIDRGFTVQNSALCITKYSSWFIASHCSSACPSNSYTINELWFSVQLERMIVRTLNRMWGGRSTPPPKFFVLALSFLTLSPWIFIYKCIG